jgi:cation diffusion facilitator CzcD-associated flavoprotein CzcO
MEIKKICVIGAGISGLVTAKTLIEEGYEVTVFEKKKGLGGVWEKSRSYPEQTTQNPRDTYCFSDFPMPTSYPEWPAAAQVQNYLESYARHFSVIDKINFQTEVTNVSRKSGEQPGWVVTIRGKDASGNQTKEEKQEFDFVAVCNGTYSSPKIPPLSGREEFIASGGQVLHSTEFNDISVIEGKRVVVVGFGKSACDIATVTAKTAKECTLVFRQAMWKLPKFFFGLINLKYLLLNRFAEAWIPYRQMGRWEKTLHTFGKPLVWAFWRLNETLLRFQFGLDQCGMLPEVPLNRVECNTSLAPDGFYEYVKTGKIRGIKSTVAKFIPGGVELANGQQLQADIVVFGTGFHQELPFLEDKYSRLVLDDQGDLYLYRHLIHPDIPQMGFVGYNNSFYTQLTSEVGAWWLAEYIKGNLALPSKSEMYEDMVAEQTWLKNQFSVIAGKGACVASISLRHSDQLMKDMDVAGEVTVWQGFSDIMNPLDPSIYNKARQKLKLQQSRSIKESRTSEQVTVK